MNAGTAAVCTACGTAHYLAGGTAGAFMASSTHSPGPAGRATYATCINGHPMGPESTICSQCGGSRAGLEMGAAAGAAGASEGAPRWLIPGLAGVAIAAVVAILLVFLAGGSPTGAKSAQIVDQISNVSCSDAARFYKDHRGSVVVVQGAGRKAVAIGRVVSVWDGTGQDGNPACNLLVTAQIPSGENSYRIIVGSATPMIVSSSTVASAESQTVWVTWSGSGWVSVQ